MPRTKAPPATLAELDRRANQKVRPRGTPNEELADFARIQRDRHTQNAADILANAEREGRALAPSEEVTLEDHLSEGERWNYRHAEYGKAADTARERASVVRESLTYENGGPHSFFRDSWQAKMGRADAKERIERHGRELAVELRAWRAKRENAQRSRGESLGVEYRATPSRTIGQGGSFAPPLYLIQEFATAPCPERVFTDLCETFTLPKGVQSVNIPRITTGTDAQTVTDTTASPGRDLTDALASSKVVTISGTSDVSLQLLEQSGPGLAHLDRVIWRDLTAAYDAELEEQATRGTGTNGQILGLLNIPGIGEITYTDASPTASELYPHLGEVFGNVSDNRKLPPEVWLLRGGRWSALATGEDENKRPLSVPFDVQSPATLEVNPVGVLLGLPVFLSESIPATLGVGGNQDAIIATRPVDSYMWESEPVLDLYKEVLSGTMQARLQLRGYVAAILGRYPTATATLTGTGLVVATNE
jgi:HK97 family phage major capsid protein